MPAVFRHSGKNMKSKKYSKKNETDTDDGQMLSPEVKAGIVVVVGFVMTFFSVISLFGGGLIAGRAWNTVLVLLFGWGRFMVPILLLALTYGAYKNFSLLSLRQNISLGVLTLCLLALFHLWIDSESAFEAVSSGYGGGYIGFLLSFPMLFFMGFWASFMVLVGAGLIALVVLLNRPLHAWFRMPSWFERLKSRFGGESFGDEDEEKEDDVTFTAKPLSEDHQPMEEDEEPESDEEDKGSASENETPHATEARQRDPLDFKNPYAGAVLDIPLGLLNNKVGKPTTGDIRSTMQKIQKTLANFNISVDMGEVSVGPTVTEYTLKPAEGVKISRITALQNDLSLAVAAHPIRIEAPIPGKSLIGIEVPNKGVAIVPLRHILESAEYKKNESLLTIALGKDVSGKPWITSLDKLPHLLVAGATGAGKSVYLNSMIISLLYKNSPETLRFIMVDPKRVELTTYNHLPHLLTPVITDIKKTVNALKWLLSEMDGRYTVLSKAGKRNIAGYNESAVQKMPYIVVIIDELADLMVTAGHEIEGAIIRLAQMARAVGIHLVLATQRPSVDVITGLIKANIPGRIAFAVASITDSRTILDMAGADKLIGRGDMLFLNAEMSKPKRIQGALVTDLEMKRIVRHIKDALGQPQYIEEVVSKQKIGQTSFDYSDDDSDGDDLLQEAKQEIIRVGKASASFLQRRLKIGYARAARLLDLLEAEGVIGPADGAKPREILSVEVAEEDAPSDAADDFTSEETFSSEDKNMT